MPMKFINILETSKLRVRGQYLDSVLYVLLHFLTLRLYKNLAPGPWQLYAALTFYILSMEMAISLRLLVIPVFRYGPTL